MSGPAKRTFDDEHFDGGVATIQIKGFYLSRTQHANRPRFRISKESVSSLEANHDPLLKAARNFSLPAPFGQASLDQLISVMRAQLGIPLGLALRILWMPDSADSEPIEIHDDAALNRVIDMTPDEIYVAAMTNSRRELWPWVSLAVSAADVGTTVALGRAVMEGPDWNGRILAYCVAGSCFLAVVSNLWIGWRHISRARKEDPLVSQWVRYHHREATIGVFLCGVLMNIICLEVLWSNVMLFCGRVNCHCPMQGRWRSTLTGVATVVSLLLADAVPLGLAVADTVWLRTSGTGGVIGIASLVTSFISLLFNLLKRFVIPQLVEPDEMAHSGMVMAGCESSGGPAKDAKPRTEELTVFRAELMGLSSLAEQPARECEQCHRFHVDARRVIARHRGSIGTFAAGWVEALFRDSGHAVRALDAAAALGELWQLEDRDGERERSSASSSSIRVATGVASGNCSHSRFGWGQRVQHIPFGPLPRLCAALAAVAADAGVSAVCNGTCSRLVPMRPLRQADRVLSDGVVHTAWMLAPPRRQMAAAPGSRRIDSVEGVPGMSSAGSVRSMATMLQLRNRRTSTPGAGQWGTVFNYLEQDKADEAAVACGQLLEQLDYEADNDAASVSGSGSSLELVGLSPRSRNRMRALLRNLHRRLLACQASGHNLYCRALRLGDASQPTGKDQHRRSGLLERPRELSGGSGRRRSSTSDSGSHGGLGLGLAVPSGADSLLDAAQRKEFQSAIADSVKQALAEELRRQSLGSSLAGSFQGHLGPRPSAAGSTRVGTPTTSSIPRNTRQRTNSAPELDSDGTQRPADAVLPRFPTSTSQGSTMPSHPLDPADVPRPRLPSGPRGNHVRRPTGPLSPPKRRSPQVQPLGPLPLPSPSAEAAPSTMVVSPSTSVLRATAPALPPPVLLARPPSPEADTQEAGLQHFRFGEGESGGALKVGKTRSKEPNGSGSNPRRASTDASGWGTRRCSTDGAFVRESSSATVSSNKAGVSLQTSMRSALSPSKDKKRSEHGQGLRVQIEEPEKHDMHRIHSDTFGDCCHSSPGGQSRDTRPCLEHAVERVELGNPAGDGRSLL